MRGIARVLAILAVGSLAVATLQAQAPGRLSGVVSDETGKPLADVQVTVTDPEVSSFSLSTKTNKKGKYAFLIKDVTRPYLCQFEKEGFQTLELTIKIPFNSNLEKNLTMPSLESLQASAANLPAPTPTESETGSVHVNPAILVFNEGAAAASAGDLETAEQKFDEAITLDPDLPEAHAALSALWLASDRFAEAATAADRALELEPGNIRAMEIRYQAHKALGNEAEAAQALAELQAASPEAAQLDRYNRGVGLFNTGAIEEAKSLFLEVLELDPGHARSHYMLGMCHVNSGDNAKAREHLERFLELAPDDADAASAREMVRYLGGS
ncbi:MAG: tetratricopeptide repeat protein [bacterium]|nr:tetratricopeptide repeat protein [bacterium]